jgi:SAM-dependent methyltransferase
VRKVVSDGYAVTMKVYDENYFDRWYRGPAAPKGEAELERQVALAVAAAESVLNRPLRSVLDVGAGEGRWQPALAELRPEATYLGIEPSEYATGRYGAERNLMSGDLSRLGEFAFEEPFDLVVCADVMHYLDDREILEAIDELADLVGGVAVLEVFTADDHAMGDREGFHLRPSIWYRRVFAGAGLVPIGLQMWVHDETASDLDALDLPTPGEHAPGV